MAMRAAVMMVLATAVWSGPWHASAAADPPVKTDAGAQPPMARTETGGPPTVTASTTAPAAAPPRGFLVPLPPPPATPATAEAPAARDLLKTCREPIFVDCFRDWRAPAPPVQPAPPPRPTNAGKPPPPPAAPQPDAASVITDSLRRQIEAAGLQSQITVDPAQKGVVPMKVGPGAAPAGPPPARPASSAVPSQPAPAPPGGNLAPESAKALADSLRRQIDAVGLGNQITIAPDQKGGQQIEIKAGPPANTGPISAGTRPKPPPPAR